MSARSAEALEPLDVEPLSDTREWGALLLRLLRLGGWEVSERPVFGFVEVVARRGDVVVSSVGVTLAEAAWETFAETEALRLWGM